MKYTYSITDTINIWDANGQAVPVYRKNQNTWAAVVNDVDRPGCRVEKMFKMVKEKPVWYESGDRFVLKPKKHNHKCRDLDAQYKAINSFISATKAELSKYKDKCFDSFFVDDVLIPTVDLALFLYWDRWSRSKLMKLNKLIRILNNPSLDSIFALTQTAIYSYHATGNIKSKHSRYSDIERKAAITNAVFFKLLDMARVVNSLKEFELIDGSGLIYEIKDMLENCYCKWKEGGIVYDDDLKIVFYGSWVPSDKALHDFIQVAMMEYLRYSARVK